MLREMIYIGLNGEILWQLTQIYTVSPKYIGCRSKKTNFGWLKVVLQKHGCCANRRKKKWGRLSEKEHVNIYTLLHTKVYMRTFVR